MRRSVSPTDLSQKAFVRGLSDGVDDDTLRRAFLKFGNVVDVNIAKDRETGNPRGFGFVTFENSSDCSKSISEMDGKEFHGRILQVELASHFNKNRGGGGFRGSSRGSFRGRGGRASSASPPRDGGFRRGSFRGGSWRGGSSRGDYKSYGGRGADSAYSGEDRFRGGFDRDPPPRDYGGRYESGYESYRTRPSERFERDTLDSRGGDYVAYRPRDYASAVDREYVPLRTRDYYTPPRDFPPSSRDYPPVSARDYPSSSRAERDYDMPTRRYAGARDYVDDYPAGNGAYDSRPPRREYDLPPRDYGASGRYESGGRGGYKSSGRGGSFAPRGGGGGGARDDYVPRGMPSRRMAPRDDDRVMMTRPRQIRSPDDGPPMKRMKSAGDMPMHRSPRGGPSSAGRRY